MHVTWLDEDTAHLRDEPEGEVRGVLGFIDTVAEWYVWPGDRPTPPGHGAPLSGNITGAEVVREIVDDTLNRRPGVKAKKRRPGGWVPLNIDQDRSVALRTEREEIAAMMENVRIPMEAEWRGRVQMFRDETRDLAVMGARVVARKGFKRLRS